VGEGEDKVVGVVVVVVEGVGVGFHILRQTVVIHPHVDSICDAFIHVE